MAIRMFKQVENSNRALPAKQGVRDHRSNKHARKCANPEASCPCTKGPWRPVERNSFLSSTEYLCGLCGQYKARTGTHRPREVIEKWIQNHAADDDGCYWCRAPFGEKGYTKGQGGKDRKNYVPALGECLCRFCYQNWKNHKTLMPVRGSHYPSGWLFVCESQKCRDRNGRRKGEAEKALSTHWFFEVKGQHQGTLHCLYCHCTGEFYERNRWKENLRNFHKDVDYGKKSLHQVEVADCVHKQTAGFRLYCKRQFGFEIVGDTEAERASAIHAIVQDFTIVPGQSPAPPSSATTSSQAPKAATENRVSPRSGLVNSLGGSDMPTTSSPVLKVATENRLNMLSTSAPRKILNDAADSEARPAAKTSSFFEPRKRSADESLGGSSKKLSSGVSSSATAAARTTASKPRPRSTAKTNSQANSIKDYFRS